MVCFEAFVYYIGRQGPLKSRLALPVFPLIHGQMFLLLFLHLKNFLLETRKCRKYVSESGYWFSYPLRPNYLFACLFLWWLSWTVLEKHICFDGSVKPLMLFPRVCSLGMSTVTLGYRSSENFGRVLSDWLFPLSFYLPVCLCWYHTSAKLH